MKKFLTSTFLMLTLFLSMNMFSQESIADSSILLPNFKMGYSASFPQADLKEHMGFTSTLTARFDVKFRNQWIVGAQYNFMFGNSVKDSGMIEELLTTGGGIINANGQFGTFELLQRGHHVNLLAGRLFPVLGPNPNCGIMATLGVGIFTHRINFNNISGDIEPIRGEKSVGYDRYTAGFSLTQFLGYQYHSNNRLLNFYAGVELTQAFTKIRRDYQVDFALDDPRFGNRNDFLVSVQVGWILPLYKRPPKEFYY